MLAQNDVIDGMGVSLTYFSTHGCIEVTHHIECRDYEYEVPICKEENSWDRDFALPEESDFAISGDEVFEEDEY